MKDQHLDPYAICDMCGNSTFFCNCLGSFENELFPSYRRHGFIPVDTTKDLSSIDNLDLIREFLKFKSEDDFYFLQILQRKKENVNLKSNSRVIRNYFIHNIDYLEERYEEIKQLCVLFNARAMIRLNKRSYSKVALQSLQNIANTIANGDVSKLYKGYSRACGQAHNDPVKKWIVDIDFNYDNYADQAYVDQVVSDIDRCAPSKPKVLLQLPTKNGVHLITTPFDRKEFSLLGHDLDIHKDNPVNLFIP